VSMHLKESPRNARSSRAFRTCIRAHMIAALQYLCGRGLGEVTEDDIRNTREQERGKGILELVKVYSITSPLVPPCCQLFSEAFYSSEKMTAEGNHDQTTPML